MSEMAVAMTVAQDKPAIPQSKTNVNRGSNTMFSRAAMTRMYIDLRDAPSPLRIPAQTPCITRIQAQM